MNRINGEARPSSFFGDIIGSYFNFSSSFIKQKNKSIGEPGILVLVFFCALVIFLSRLPYQISLWHVAQSRDAFITVFGVLFFVTIFFVPLMLYLLSIIIHLILKCFFGKGSFYDTRLALFWSLAVVSPVLLLTGIIKGYFFDSLAIQFFDLPSKILLGWVLSVMLANAHSYRSFVPLLIFLLFIVLIPTGYLYKNQWST